MKKTNEIWTIGSILKWTGQYFGEKGVENPRLDAEVLLSHILGMERIQLYVHFEQPLQQHELAEFRAAVKKRATRIPVAYITGCKEFMGLNFTVAPEVLIPRPDTEILVEASLERLNNIGQPHILDIGTGSGAIIISLLARLPAACGAAVDISDKALAVAGGNAAKHQVGDRLTLHRGDVYQPVAGQTYHAILSNPPYIPDSDIAGLAPEVRQEPLVALAGGQDGLSFYRRLIRDADEFLKPGGFIALEVGIHQACPVASLADALPQLKPEAVIKDYGGVERVVILRKSQEG
ncbi:peptide chain release factor N(5)-glutamine methyltransferase|uniref:Release factor glutamine methyltransferase n=1 Tax=Dendrosporobacter quercicolus TaxID=146817 RepID=A0A1G9QTW0_9FIRM|nr:peptide chain release factor N(5)-glutamine methyltransferase [Dendrosporobacter quercicolus]NSL48341.1 peptide chain release factor N(5)-glutamine methyltransferase [Dendrosporobacter quercicolus DSM 1736]SDM13695.1 release factor glutamine methyltransferase [Dendrosporobacter quercicolus]